MNNDALVAALGMDAVAAVHGYRLRVIREADRHGQRLVSDALSEAVRTSTGCHIVDPIDIRLTFRRSRGGGDLAGRLLRWGPAHGWSSAHLTVHNPVSYYADAGAAPLHLVPKPRDVVAWATGKLDRPGAPPRGVDLDDDPAAIRRLLSFIDPHHGPRLLEDYRPAIRPRAPGRRARTRRASRVTDPRPHTSPEDGGPAARAGTEIGMTGGQHATLSA